MQFDANGKTPLAEGGEGIIYEYGKNYTIEKSIDTE